MPAGAQSLKEGRQPEKLGGDARGHVTRYIILQDGRNVFLTSNSCDLVDRVLCGVSSGFAYCTLPVVLGDHDGGLGKTEF